MAEGEADAVAGDAPADHHGGQQERVEVAPAGHGRGEQNEGLTGEDQADEGAGLPDGQGEDHGI
jgi:hypothetical protein